MTRVMTLFRDQPVLLAIGFGLLVVTGVIGFIGVLMLRAGVSLKPLAFFTIFFALIAGPQIVYHTLRAFGRIPDVNAAPSSPRVAAVESESVLATQNGRFVSADAVFGAGFDPDLRSDVRRLFPSTNPAAAEMAIFRTGQSVIAARFASVEDARTAAGNYASMLAEQWPAADRDGTHTLQRANDWVRIFQVGRTFFVWSSPDRAGLDSRQAASHACWSTDDRVAADVANENARNNSTRRVFFATVALLVVVSTVWFFKGSSWAATVSAQENWTTPTSADVLMNQLLGLEHLGQPITVKRGSNPNEIEVTWRIDATWLTLASVQGIQRIHKLLIELDESSHCARVKEYASALDTTTGIDGGKIDWRIQKGITFFEYAKEASCGISYDPSTGSFRPKMNYHYTFDLQELKSPLITAVTRSGWTWKPVQWNAPQWLRWIVE